MILCRVQHHPSRADLIPDLLEALEPLYVEISSHESIPPDPWAGYKQCLSNLPDCSHVLVIQDDAQPVPNFGTAVEQIAERYPDTPVCLFLGAAPASTAAMARRAMMNDRRYVPLGPANFVPAVAILWPRQKAMDFMHWARNTRTTRADDGNMSKWKQRTKQQIQVACPSLVEHNDGLPSTKGGRDHLPWKESWRRALFLASDGLDYKW